MPVVKRKNIVLGMAFLLAVISFSMVLRAFGKTPEALPVGVISYSKSIPEMQSKSYVLMDEDSGEILCDNASETELPPASITKIMTLLLSMEAIRDGKFTYETMVRVSEHAASLGGSQVYLEPGEELSVRDMIKCICIASANDASVAMAELVAESEEAFVQKMNARAKELGMNHTRFVNCYGLDSEGHYSCAKDVAIMSRELMHNFPEITEFTTTWMDSIVHRTKKGETEFGLSNTNKLIRTYQGITGLKTGSTGKALYCLSATATRNQVKLIAVIMGAPSTKVRFSEAAKLLDYGFTNYYRYTDPEKSVLKIKIRGAMKPEIFGTTETEFGFLLPVGISTENVEKEMESEQGLTAPIKCGQYIGRITYTCRGRVMGVREIYAAEDVKKATYFDYFRKLLHCFL